MTDDTTIGIAFMKPDHTIVLSVRADDGAGTVGHATIVYAPDDAHYRDVLTHLGGISPGESKSVRPWD